ncbi:MAG: type II toxin-antitoxin system mRNA interferase toxin, RelE/StbE family [Immundisolibacteraceae bacterium]|nr:type II toxin-antitoxin system mRNA interferase toxin, RelE/StbE family [Immundisolibacteraceae bacterium]
MWEIYQHRRVEKQLRKLPAELLKRYQKWKDILSISGPSGLRSIRGFNDEPLSGAWQGYRSSRLNQQYRVIYKIEQQRLVVAVVEVTPRDYRRK